MNKTGFPIEIYRANIEKYNSELQKLNEKKNRIAWARLGVMILIAIAAWQLYPVSLLFMFIALILLLAVFIRLVFIATNTKASIAHVKLLLHINQQEIAIEDRNYLNLADGHSFLPHVHEYANDLDIFGRASLYQYINRTTSEQGHQTLANWFLKPSDIDIIIARQEAIKELAPLYDWRQQLQAHGLAQQIKQATEGKLAGWLQQPYQFINTSWWKSIRIIYPVITLSILSLHIIGVVSSPVFWTMIIIFLGLSSLASKKVIPQYIQLNKAVEEMDVLHNSLVCIEERSFKSSLLLRLQQSFKADNGKASSAVKALKGILDRFDYRLNPLVFVPLNAFLLWDIQQVLQLERWKQSHREHVVSWFRDLGHIEALSTLANLHCNHPEWAFPSFDNAEGTLQGKEIGHPLIPDDKRVTSSFSTEGKGKIALVTGSNMAGKSTFLRSIGVNVVLAMMGAPVCATVFRLSSMRVVSSMRIADNLEENTSTFYAELKKLKYIIECVNNGEKVFLLLDEILRGTNSLDRHTGSKALIKQLMLHKGNGILATHDIELAQLEKEFPDGIHNYHFDVQVNNEELYFDYKLKEGICKSLNASILMKKIGIEL